MDTKFWMVWNPDGYAPRVKHQTKAAAAREAERLARTNREHSFIVLEAVASVRVREVDWTPLHDLSSGLAYAEPIPDDDLPF